MFVMYVTYCHRSIKIWDFTPETQLSIAFYYRVFDRMLNYGLKSQQMVLHAHLQSEMFFCFLFVCCCFFLVFFFFFFGGGGNHIQQLIILKVIMIETRCLQF